MKGIPRTSINIKSVSLDIARFLLIHINKKFRGADRLSKLVPLLKEVIMGIFDGIKKEVLDKVSTLSSQNPLLDQALNLINNPQTGGMAGLMESLNKGLGDVMSSGIASGENKPITAEQIQNVLGSDQIKAIADKAGIPGGTGHRRVGQLDSPDYR